MSGSPVVSVVMASYNNGQYIGQAINSVISQTFKSWELVIVDDGSTDSTKEAVKPFLQNRTIKYLSILHSGQVIAKNVGIRNSVGAFIAFLDSDDYWEPTKLADQMELFGNSDVGVTFTEVGVANEVGRELGIAAVPRFRGQVLDRMYGNNFVPFSSSMVRRSLLDRIGLFDERIKMGIDYDLWLRASLVTEFDYVDKLLVWIRRSSTQMSNNVEGREYWATEIERRFRAQFPAKVTPEMELECRFGRMYTKFRTYAQRDYWKAIGAIMAMIRMRPASLAPYRSLGRFLLVDVLGIIHRDS